MSNSVAETVIGAAVLATAAAFVGYAGQTSGMRVSGETYPLSAQFRSVEGVAVGTDVRLAGIKIGSVTALALDPENYLARADFNVRQDVALPEDSDIKIASEGLLGGSFIEITPGASDIMLAPGDEILNTQGTVDLLNLLMRFGGGS